MVSFIEGRFFPSGDSSDSSSFTSFSSSLLSSGMLHQLETPYIDRVYHATLLAVSHPGEEKVEGDATTASSSPLVSRASRQKKSPS